MPSSRIEWPLVIASLLAVSVAALVFFLQRGDTLAYGDAQAHLANARRILDSRTPGYDQVGTGWLPLPHVLMLPFVTNDAWWRSGLAGALPVSLCFVLAGAFLYGLTRDALHSRAAAVTAITLFALNPNLLYLQSTPMTEPVLFAAVLGLLWATIRFRQTRSWAAVLAASVASNAASLTRYDGWILIPFVCLYLLAVGGPRRWRAALLFGALASLGPLYWLAHNAWYYGDPLEFYHGPYSTKAIYQRGLARGGPRQPGDHDWPIAWLYYRTAGQLCAGAGLVAVGLLGTMLAAWRKAPWPLAFLALTPLFYVFSVYSGGAELFLPELWPHSYYNSRYGLAVLPLLAFGAATLVASLPKRLTIGGAALVVAVALWPWITNPRPDAWICWQESQVNSVARRAWTRQAAAALRAVYHPGDGIVGLLSDVVGVYREAGIPLRAVLHDGNNPHWLAATARPDLFLWEPWAVSQADDAVTAALERATQRGVRYVRVHTVRVQGAPDVIVWRRENVALPAPATR